MNAKFNKADVLRILKDREEQLTRQFNSRNNEIKKANDDDKIRKDLERQWAKILFPALRPGLVVDGLKVKKNAKMIQEIAHDIVGENYGSFRSCWDADKAVSITQLKRDYSKLHGDLTARYNKAQTALRTLREEISLAGVPADIVKRLNAISAMMAK